MLFAFDCAGGFCAAVPGLDGDCDRVCVRFSCAGGGCAAVPRLDVGCCGCLVGDWARDGGFELGRDGGFEAGCCAAVPRLDEGGSGCLVGDWARDGSFELGRDLGRSTGWFPPCGAGEAPREPFGDMAAGRPGSRRMAAACSPKHSFWMRAPILASLCCGPEMQRKRTSAPTLSFVHMTP